MRRAAVILSAIMLLASFAFCADAEKTPDDNSIAFSTLEPKTAPSVVYTPQGVAETVQVPPQPVLKKIDINRISAEPSYDTFATQRLGGYFPVKYFTIAQRVEIYQEARPIDAYVLDAKKIRWLHYNQPWNTDGEYRQQIRPIFTRAYGTEITISDPKGTEGAIRYTIDYRDIYQGQFPIYRLNPDGATQTDISYLLDNNYKVEHWLQNDILLMYAKQIPGIDWYFSANFGYRYSDMNANNDAATDSYHENRHTLYTYFSLAPTDRLEVFGQLEYFKSHRPDSTFIFNPDHYFAAGELRLRSKDKKTMVVPRMSYSVDYYFPFTNFFSKYEMQIRAGHDFTPKLSATTTVKCVMSVRDEKDNQAPLYTGPGVNPIHDMSGWVGVENRAQYNFFDRLWLQGGVDFAAGTNMCDFDNWAMLTGLEYYAPGLLRVDFGYRGNDYYNIRKWMSSLYFKVYLFM